MTTVNIDDVVEEVIAQVRETKDSRHISRITQTARERGHDMAQPLNIKKELMEALAEVCHESARHHTRAMWEQIKKTGDLVHLPFLVENLALMGEGFCFLFPGKNKETEAAAAFLQQIHHIHTLASDGEVAPASKSLPKNNFDSYQKTGKPEFLLMSLGILAGNRGKIRDLVPAPSDEEAIKRFFAIILQKKQGRDVVSEQRPLLDKPVMNLLSLRKGS